MSLPISLPDGKTLNIKIKKSIRAKNLRIRVDVLGVYAIVPANYDVKDLVNFIDNKKNWIANASRYYDKLRMKYDEQHLRTNTISFLGKRYQFKMIKDKISSILISENLKLITFHVADKRKYKNDILKWYEIETANIIAKRLPLIASKLNIQYNAFSIKKQKSRWGSCSKKRRNLYFNLLLSATPMEVIDYVIAHELIHIVEPNHSKN